MRWQWGELTVTDDRRTLDVDLIHELLRTSYWAEGVPREVVSRSLEHSLCLGMYRGSEQIGFGRAVTDRATFAYLSDVFIVSAWRGRDLGSWLVQCFLEHPDLQGLRRWMLATRDAHGLYARHGFAGLERPDWFMEIVDPSVTTPPLQHGREEPT